MADPYNLARFVAAQHDIFTAALSELRAGHKQSHWMWFVFPQLAALGRSPTAKHFGIVGVDEAHAYLAHPVLGPRLAAAIDALLSAPGNDPVAILGPVDSMKLGSSMTLFGRAGERARCREVLDRFFAGAEDEATRQLLETGAG